MVVVVLDFSTKTQNKPSKTSEEELIQILKRLAKVLGNSHRRSEMLVVLFRVINLAQGVHDETPLFLAVKVPFSVYSKR